jgi:2-polyprenyl-3-methyl-5-hydroxy-6-metoxy-1,4-benzoquinol methylase
MFLPYLSAHTNFTVFSGEVETLKEAFVPITLDQGDACVDVEDLPNGKRRIAVRARTPELFIPTSQWETSYPLAVIEHIWRIKGAAYLCDEIRRDEDPSYVQLDLRYSLLSFLPETAFVGKRLLDFGCGGGASTMILARMFPDMRIVGLELKEDLLSVARLRAQCYGLSTVTFRRSPDGSHIPADIGEFDFILLSAVLEHLLPQERTAILPQLWSVLKPGGVLFIDQTPHRYSPIERHTTGMPLLNYVPDRLAFVAARRFSKRIAPTDTWIDLLRNGIRGSTTREIMTILRGAGSSSPILLKSKRLGIKSSTDLRLRIAYERGIHTQTRALTLWLKKLVYRSAGLFGINVISSLTLAVRKGTA